MEKLPVIFRVFQGETLALFPTLPGTYDPHTCTCYAHIGQHGSADTRLFSEGRPAKPSEYEPLLRELRSIYETGEDACELIVKKRHTAAHLAERRRALKSLS